MLLGGAALASTALALCIDGKQQRTLVRAQRGPACAVVWDVGGLATPGPSPRRAWRLTCPDGDPSCDADGVRNGTCLLSLGVCLNASAENCPTARVSRLRLPKGFARIVPLDLEPPFADPGCSAPRLVQLPLRRRAGERLRSSQRLRLTVRARSPAGPIRNRIDLECSPSLAPDPCPSRGVPGDPWVARMQFPENGGDVEVLTSVTQRTSGLAACTRLTLCLTGCDASVDPRCDAFGATGDGQPNGATLGPPLPLISASVPLCLVHRWANDVTGELALDTGAAALRLGLSQDVYLATSAAEPCPACQSAGGVGSIGRCSSAAGAPGAQCIVESRDPVRGIGLSRDCVPAHPIISFSLEVPLTTGPVSPPPTSAPGCLAGGWPTMQSGSTAVPQPRWPDPMYPKTATGMVLAGAFCAAPDGYNLLGPRPPSITGLVTLPVGALTVHGSP